MRISPRDAAAQRRRGVLARAAYAVRKARTAAKEARCDSAPRLPLADAPPGGVRQAAARRSASPSASSACEALPTERVEKRRPTRRARGPLFILTQRDCDEAERRAAPGFLHVFTDGGRVAPRVAVRRLNWTHARHAQAALTAARCLELLPTPLDPVYVPVCATLVGMIASARLADVTPEFDQASLRASAAGSGTLLALPITGRLGWRRRARFMGCL